MHKTNKTPAELAARYPKPKPGASGAITGLEAFCEYLKLHNYRIIGTRGDLILIGPKPKEGSEK